MSARLIAAALLLAAAVQPAWAEEPLSTVLKADRFLAPAETWFECATVAGGSLLLTAKIGDNQMDEQVSLDLSRTEGAYGMPLFVVSATPGDVYAVHRVNAGEYCVRASLSWHPDWYVPGRPPPLWTGTRIEVHLEHRPA